MLLEHGKLLLEAQCSWLGSDKQGSGVRQGSELGLGAEGMHWLYLCRRPGRITGCRMMSPQK